MKYYKSAMNLMILDVMSNKRPHVNTQPLGECQPIRDLGNKQIPGPLRGAHVSGISEVLKAVWVVLRMLPSLKLQPTLRTTLHGSPYELPEDARPQVRVGVGIE